MNMPADSDAAAAEGNQPERPSRPASISAKNITMAAIAKAAGVSQGAISSLLNDRDYGIRVSDRTRERVFKVCRELGYRPYDLRAYVRMYPEHGDTCLFLPSTSPGLADPHIARIASRIMSRVTQGGFAIAVYEENRIYQTDEELPPAAANGTASKFISIGTPNSSLCRLVLRRGLPLIFLGQVVQIPGTTSILPDYGAAARLALGAFVRAGHRAIGIVGGPFGSPDPRLAELSRSIGYASQELGATIAAQNIFQGDLTYSAGAAAVDALVERKPTPTALLCLSEASACGVVSCALTRGIRIPEQLSVVAIADHSSEAASCAPISTIAMPVDAMADTAMDEIERQLASGLPTDFHRITLGVKYCERDSVVPP